MDPKMKKAMSAPEVVDTMNDEFGRENHRLVHVPIERRMPIGGIGIDPDSDAGGIEVEVLRQMAHYIEQRRDSSRSEGPITERLTFEYGRYRVQLNLGDAVGDE